jgi:uncharacterized membrane protein YvbJ
MFIFISQLHEAVKAGDLNKVKTLLESNDIDVNVKDQVIQSNPYLSLVALCGTKRV